MRVTRRWTAYLFPIKKIKTMKLHLPTALLACVAAATAMASETKVPSPVVVTPSTVDTVTEDVTYTGKLPDGLYSTKDISKTPYVKDGQGTMTIKDIKDTNTTTRASLSVREGSVLLQNSNINFKGNGSSYGLNVGGTNASLQLENSNVTNYYYMTVGGPDGKGALSLKDSNLKVTGTLNVGTPMGWWWDKSCTNVSSTKVSKDSTDVYYGQYDNSEKTTEYDRDFGTGTVTVAGNSSLEVGTTLVMHNATLNVTGSEAKVTFNTGYNLAGTPFEDMGAGGGIMLARTSGSTTNINVTKGATFNALHMISGMYGATNTATNIKVDGEKSSLNVTGTMALGYGDEAQATSKATLTVTGGATLDAGALLLGEQVSKHRTHEVAVTVGEGSLVSADELNISYGANMEVSGSLSVEELYMNAGTLTLNEGSNLTITLDTLPANGAVITLGEEAIFTDLGSKITLTLVGSALEALVNGGAEFVLVAGANTDDTVAVNNVTINTTVAGATIDEVQFNRNDDGSVSVKASASIPEPTTATLSLLALAALAARRRRK